MRSSRPEALFGARVGRLRDAAAPPFTNHMDIVPATTAGIAQTGTAMLS
jgi:hypothetical protein